MPRGGFRRGGGRKRGTKEPHTIRALEARAYVIASIIKDLDPILQAQKESAKGMWVERITKEGKSIVYQKDPSFKAGEYLLSQLIGRPKETLELDGKPIEIDVVIKSLVGKIYGNNNS